VIQLVATLWLALFSLTVIAIDTEEDLPTPALQERYERLIN
jgi:hypothetical protein